MNKKDKRMEATQKETICFRKYYLEW